MIKIFTISSTTLYRRWSAFSLSRAIIKSRRLSTVFSNVFSGFKNSIAGGISPLNTAVACLLSLLIANVTPSAAESSSTDGLVLTVTRILLLSLILSTICFTTFDSAMVVPVFVSMRLWGHYTISSLRSSIDFCHFTNRGI